MSETDKHEHWKQLAECLGAELAEESTPARRAEESVTALPAAAVPTPPPRPQAKRVEPRRAKHWDWLASELGIAAPPQPASEPAQTALGVSTTVAGPGETSPVPAATPTALEVPAAVTWDAEPAAATGEFVGGSEPAVDPLALEAPPFVEEVAAAVEFEVAEGDEDAQREEEGEQRMRRRRRRGRRRRRDETGDRALAEVSAEREGEEPPADAEPEVMESVSDERASEEVADRDEQRTRRRRRRRRRATRADQLPAQQEAAEGDEEPPSDEEPEPAEEDEDLDEAEDAHEGLADSPRPKHRKIPSWTEAMDHIININMATRARNPSGGSRGKNRR